MAACILIAGGGIGGLAAAVALARRGHSIEVLDQTAEFGEVGAGRLVDACGLKGYRIGDAQISHIHANIMVNLGEATSADVIALVRHAQKMVKESSGHDLEPEINFVGEF